MFSLIFFQLYSISVLKTPAIKSVLPKIKTKKQAEKVIHKDAFLEKAVKGFMSHNHEIISIQHKLKSTMYEYGQERGKILPRLDFVGGLGNEQKLSVPYDNGSKNYSNTSETSLSYGVKASYNLFDGFALMNNARAKDFDVQSEIYKGIDTVAKKLLDFIELILTIQEAELKVESGTRDVERKQKMYQEAKNRVAVGAVGKQDEFQAHAALDQAKGMAEDAKRDFKNAKIRFQEWTGIEYEKIQWLSMPEILLTSFDQWEATLHKTNISILQTQMGLRAQEKNQKAVNGKLFSPRFALDFSARNNISKGFEEDSKTNKIMTSREKNTRTELSTNLQCTMPLWSGGSDKSEALKASESVAAARHAFYSATQNAKIDFQNAKESFISAQEYHQLYTSIVDSYQKSYEIALDKYQSGVSSFTDLTDIADRLNRAERMLVEKDKARRKTAWELTRILGSLTPAKLCASLDKTFDPLSDYNKVKSRI